MSRVQKVIKEIEEIGICSKVYETKRLGGGCTGDAWYCNTDQGELFLKSNTDKSAYVMFEAEALALEKIHYILPGFAPKTIHCGEKKKGLSPYIVTEYIHMESLVSDPDINIKMGKKLARLHSAEIENPFGFDVPSFCGTTPLDNSYNSDWCQFWLKQRMVPLLDQVKGQNPDLDRLANSLCARMDHWIGKDALPKVKPTLLHGDLWSGNWAVNTQTNNPVIFDPAPYYGHNEVEFGIMKMFGGLDSALMDAYDTHFQIQDTEGRDERVMLYELYHHLNHYAMFGGGYDSGCLNIMESLL